MASIKETAKEISILVPKLIVGIKGNFFMQDDITTPQIITILSLYERDMLKITILAKRLRVSAPTITGLIDRLERGEYVKRIRDTQDRRVVFVKLTKKGIDFVEKFKGTVQKRWSQILVHLTDDERFVYVKILKKLISVLSNEAQTQKVEDREI